MAITWKNINSDLADTALAAARITENANAGIAQGIRGLAGNLEDYRTDKTDKNTSAYLDQLAGYGSAEELDAARQSGLLANMRSGFGDFIDPNALRGAADTRRNELFAEKTATRNRANADYTYGQNQLKQKLVPVEESIKAAIASKNFDKAERIAAEYQEDFKNAGAYGDILSRINSQAEEERLAIRAKENETYTDGQRDRNLTKQKETDYQSDAISKMEERIRSYVGRNDKYGSVLTDTKIQQNLRENFRRDFDVPLSVIDGVLSNLDTSQVTGSSLASTDQNKVDSVSAKLIANLERSGNAYLKDEGMNPLSMANEVISYGIENNEDFRQEFDQGIFDDGAGISKAIGEMLDSGIKLPNPQGGYSVIPVPSDMMKMAVRTFSGRLLSGDDTKTFVDHVRSLVTQQGLASIYDEYGKNRDAREKLKADSLARFSKGTKSDPATKREDPLAAFYKKK